VNKLLYIQINRRTLRRERSFTMLSEEEEEEDTVDDAGEDAISSRLVYMTEVK
jgi:DNA replication protein DnaC